MRRLTSRASHWRRHRHQNPTRLTGGAGDARVGPRQVRTTLARSGPDDLTDPCPAACPRRSTQPTGGANREALRRSGETRLSLQPTGCVIAAATRSVGRQGRAPPPRWIETEKLPKAAVAVAVASAAAAAARVAARKSATLPSPRGQVREAERSVPGARQIAAVRQAETRRVGKAA